MCRAPVGGAARSRLGSERPPRLAGRPEDALSGAQCQPVVDAGEVVEGRSVGCYEDPARGSRRRGDLQVVGSAGPSGAAGASQQDCVVASDFTNGAMRTPASRVTRSGVAACCLPSEVADVTKVIEPCFIRRQVVEDATKVGSGAASRGCDRCDHPPAANHGEGLPAVLNGVQEIGEPLGRVGGADLAHWIG